MKIIINYYDGFNKNVYRNIYQYLEIFKVREK